MGVFRFGLVLVVACSFERGALPKDALPAVDDGTIDGPSDGPPTPPTDAMIDGPVSNTCTTSGLTCAGTATAIGCNGGCWVKCVSTVAIPNQTTAAAACAIWGGKLAPMKSTSDQTCVAVTLFPGQANWIGLEQASTATTVGANWTWNSDGVAITFDAWDTGQPNDLNGNENDHAEQCAYMNTDGDWHDEPCSTGTLYRFSCRR